mgnify:CR=1 FL=1
MMNIIREPHKIIFKTRRLNFLPLIIIFLINIIAFFYLFFSSSSEYLIQCSLNEKVIHKDYPYNCEVIEYDGNSFIKKENKVGFVKLFLIGKITTKQQQGNLALLAKTAYGNIEILKNTNNDHLDKIKITNKLNEQINLSMPFFTVLERHVYPRGYFSFIFLLIALISIKSFYFNYKNIRNIVYDGHEHTLQLFDVLDKEYIALNVDSISKVEIVTPFMVFRHQHPWFAKLAINGDWWFAKRKPHTPKPQGIHFYINKTRFFFITYMSEIDFKQLIEELKILIDLRNAKNN